MRLRTSLSGVSFTKRIVLFLVCCVLVSVYSKTYSQNRSAKILSGTITDTYNRPLAGADIRIKGFKTGTISDINGNFSLSVPGDSQTLEFSFAGMASREIAIGNQTEITISLAEPEIGMEERVAVGYGMQKKENVLGSIVQVTNQQLKRSGGVTNLAHALTGNLPGLTTFQYSGEPGNDDPTLLVRAQGTWNNSQPLILVDGVERKMNDIDVSEVESISLLKDASATAVFGVKGSEGVILITTKRGRIGKPEITADVSTGFKYPSKYASKLDSYEGLKYRNSAIEYELPVKETGWAYYTPIPVLNRYKKPQARASETGLPYDDEYIFPNVDWSKEFLKKYTLSSRVNLNISGGTDFVRYFGSLTFNHDGDILNTGLENGKPYKSHWDYDRFNYRTNLDFDITKSTLLTVNLSGYVGIKTNLSNPGGSLNVLNSFNIMPPNSFPVRFPTGEWGYNPLTFSLGNPVMRINNRGYAQRIRTQLSTDFRLTQKLDIITRGLEISGSLSYDTRFTTAGGVAEFSDGNALVKYIDPKIIDKTASQTDLDYTYGSLKALGPEDFDFVLIPVNYVQEGYTFTSDESIYGGLNQQLNPPHYRRIYYQTRINYARTFNKHELSALGMFSREQFAELSMFPRYREDWVGRINYDFAGKYLLETNAAYNGSEKFGPGYRFGFFPSVAIGWIASNEKFLDFDWLDKLKFRYSIGKVGNDNFTSVRWKYLTTWSQADQTIFGPSITKSPYVQYLQSAIGNPNLHWEKSTRQNYGTELSLLKNKINLDIDYFTDHRTDIFMNQNQRKIPAYYGNYPAGANIGETKTRGYELEFNFRNSIKDNFRYWFDWAYTHAIDKIIYMEDRQMDFDYQKNAGFQIAQTKTLIHNGYLNTWDDVYAGTSGSTNNDYKLPGDVRMIDFNADGIIDSYDTAPWAYPNRPQNTYSFSLGADWKGFSAMVQFFGVFNTSRLYSRDYTAFTDDLSSVVFDEIQADIWTPVNLNSKWKAQRFQSLSYDGTLMYVDGSYLRLKTAEIAYTLNNDWLQKTGLSSVRIYMNGNNLFFWSDMVDERESSQDDTAYPMMKLLKLGLSVIF